jgi:hypothetical protein
MGRQMAGNLGDKHKIRLLSFAIVLFLLSCSINNVAFSLPLAGSGLYLTSGVLTILVCLFALLHKWRLMQVLMLIDLLCLILGTIKTYLESPSLMF